MSNIRETIKDGFIGGKGDYSVSGIGTNSGLEARSSG